MKYDFTTILERQGKDAIAVDGLGKMPGFAPEMPKEGFDVIPMWIADMNFPTAPSILKAMENRIKHPSFGYFMPSEDYINSIIRWQAKRNHVNDITPECISYENGVLGGVMSAMRAFLQPGDSVLLHSPTYVGFTHSITSGGYKIVHSPLIQDENGIWRMDYEDMDRKLKENHIHVAVFCNPHNPCGRVWERDELEKAMEVYKNNNCVVVSDEIWSDIILGDYHHIPLSSISEDAKNRTISFYAPSKTFSLAGLVGSYHIIYNEYLRDLVRASASKCHYNSMNVLSMHALIGAYSEEGEVWVNELCETLTGNIDYAYNHIIKYYEGVKVTKPQGTYMLFLDCTEWCNKTGKDIEELLKAGWDVGVAWQDGRAFHGANSIRMNLALPLSRVKEAFKRLDQYVFNV